MHGKGDIVENDCVGVSLGPGPVEIPHLQHGVSGSYRRLLLKEIGKMTTDHELHDSLGCRLRLRHFTGILPIAQNDNAVANREDFFNAMGYENYAETAFTKSANNSEECGDLGIGQSGGGFIHDHNTR